jgi:hypothetical protein
MVNRKRSLNDTFSRLLPGSLWRHRKGGIYAVVVVATREADRQPDIVYRCLRSGVVYTRPATEFLDGRFRRTGRLVPRPEAVTGACRR